VLVVAGVIVFAITLFAGFVVWFFTSALERSPADEATAEARFQGASRPVSRSRRGGLSPGALDRVGTERQSQSRTIETTNPAKAPRPAPYMAPITAVVSLPTSGL